MRRDAAHEQVPAHPLAGVAVGLDARRLDLGIEEERQGQRQHLGLAGTVVAPEQKMAVAEPELLAVVVVELDEAQAQRLPARSLGTGRAGLDASGSEANSGVSIMSAPAPRR